MNYPQANVAHLFVGKYGVAPKTSGTIETYADMTDGAIAFVSEGNVAQSDITAVTRFRIAQRSGTSLLFSPWIERATITDAHTYNYVAPVQQISYIGYNGSSGSFTVTNSNVYKARIELDGSSLKQFGNKRMLKFGVYKSDASATQAEVAHGFLTNLLANFKDETLAQIKFELINSCAVTAGDKLDHNLTVVNGLTTVTVATNIEFSSGETPVVGDYLRLGTVGGGTALTSPVYKITSIDSLVFTLDRAVTNASGTYATATADAEIIRTANIGNFGIKCTGVANEFQVGKWKYFITTFTVDLQDFGATAVTYTTPAVQGIGYGAQIQEMQYLLQGNWGNKYRSDEYAPAFINDAVATTAYNLASFKYRMDSSEQLGYRVSSPAEIILALGNDNTQDNATLNILQTDTTHFIAANFADFS